MFQSTARSTNAANLGACLHGGARSGASRTPQRSDRSQTQTSLQLQLPGWGQASSAPSRPPPQSRPRPPARPPAEGPPTPQEEPLRRALPLHSSAQRGEAAERRSPSPRAPRAPRAPRPYVAAGGRRLPPRELRPQAARQAAGTLCPLPPSCSPPDGRARLQTALRDRGAPQQPVGGIGAQV